RRPTAAWLAALQGRLPVAPVYGLAQALENPFVHAQGGVQTTPHPALHGMRLLASPIRLDGARLPGRACSALGADNSALLPTAVTKPAA
ncbi:MAG: CoA transferase, partial [Betaproteobacteria bacterium]